MEHPPAFSAYSSSSCSLGKKWGRGKNGDVYDFMLFYSIYFNQYIKNNWGQSKIKGV